MYRRYVKRVIDLAGALVGFSVLLPLFLLCTVLLSLANQGSPFFVQVRPGLQGRLFKIIKFKTMNDRTDDQGHLLPDAARLTAIGRIVRKTSLDEIPQLLNVIKGDMSLIGPRPLLPEYLPLYSSHQARRHEVRPGITGWAQVNGRNTITWEQKFDLDVWYVDHLSPGLDLKIFFRTIAKVFRSEGISQPGEATMQKFSGMRKNELEV
jgi:undecaprenyl phosphate N,N'-diacetylbacillosamine 1-phosphate transferase